MASNRFQSLCVRLCSKLKLRRFKLDDGKNGSLGFCMKRQGVSVSILYFPKADARQAVMTFDFASVPHEDPRVPQIMAAMLDTNSPVALSLETIDLSVTLALEWRRERFPRQVAPDQQPSDRRLAMGMASAT